MSGSSWLMLVSVFILILGIIFGFGWWYRNNIIPPPAPPNKYSEPLVWSTPQKGPDPKKNFCQLYQFPTIVTDIEGIPTAIPGTPTFNPNVLFKLQGKASYPSCLDNDQVMAQQVSHTCTGPNGVLDDSITRCFLINGGITVLGGSESYFTNSGCFNVAPCLGQVSLVSINFQAPTISNINCIQNHGTGNNVTMESCNPGIIEQLFRVTRINPGENPNTPQPGKGQNGLFSQIFDRTTGLCLVPGNVTTTTTYDPNYLTPIDSSCTGPPEQVSGTNLVLGQCTGGVFPGYVWALLPSVSYCSVTGGCGGCTGCNGCRRILGSNNCTGCVDCSGNESSTTSPQIVYIGNLNINDIPLGPTGYNGLTGSSAIIQWFIDNKAQSLYYGGQGTGLILKDIGTDYQICSQKPFISQYLNLTTYNTLIAQEVCINTSLNCVGL